MRGYDLKIYRDLNILSIFTLTVINVTIITYNTSTHSISLFMLTHFLCLNRLTTV